MLKKLKEERNGLNFSAKQLFKDGFISGLGWSFGVTIGFVLISTLVVAVLSSLGGLPLVGSFIADIVDETQKQLINRTPLFYGR
jgi:hypothetical protein